VIFVSWYTSAEIYSLAGSMHIGDSLLLCKKLKTYQFISCASPEYLAKYGTPLVPQELKNHACLLYSQPGSTQNGNFQNNKKT
jgi:hypothetical protein